MAKEKVEEEAGVAGVAAVAAPVVVGVVYVGLTLALA